jgi:hypothetical protein
LGSLLHQLQIRSLRHVQLDGLNNGQGRYTQKTHGDVLLPGEHLLRCEKFDQCTGQRVVVGASGLESGLVLLCFLVPPFVEHGCESYDKVCPAEYTGKCGFSE